MPRIRQICVACHDFRSELGHGEEFRTRAFVEQFLIDHGFTLASVLATRAILFATTFLGLRAKARKLERMGARWDEP